MECTIRGIPVKFPFEPYSIQKDYMAKVIECLQTEVHGVLESPTGTGKTLSLLCSSLAWLEVKKAQIQAQWNESVLRGQSGDQASDLISQLNEIGGPSKAHSAMLGMPQIIYSSRTHSQLSQAMQELKRTAYSYMKASVLGSRDQMCIHPEIMKEENSANKINMCLIKVHSRSCNFYNRIERLKDSPLLFNQTVIDIEDLVQLGEKHKFCPFFMSKAIRQRSDIVFMPYNYLLDPRARKALGIELSNNIIILDEAHNIEKICEESASFEIKTTDIALCIEEITAIMKVFSKENSDFDLMDNPPDITSDELCTLKEIFLGLEKVLDGVEIKNRSDGCTFPGDHVFTMLRDAGINDDNNVILTIMMDRIIQFLSTVNTGPLQRKGHGLQLFQDMLRITFASNEPEFKEKIKKCYKVHIKIEEPQNEKQTNWTSKATKKKGGRVLNFWCFSPGFGMNMLLDQGVKVVILTSGTLAPLKPLIQELGMKIGVQLENPHIVTEKQVCVKILGKGPDGQQLNCNYQNRSNPAYVKSLGMTISNLVNFIPNGLLIFFPSYPLMRAFKEAWQNEGIWSTICKKKSIFIEPKEKLAFQEAMTNYYQSVNDPNLKGAIFMGVCRGKVAEGLDFADANGRAVIIIGLPYPPLMDPRIVLKKKYLDVCRETNSEYLSGDSWYSLEATKAVNQAIGRVIRHQNDYGAIILLDSRFNNPRIINQMSLWLRKHVKNANNFGEVIRELRTFYGDAQEKFPVTNLRLQKSQATYFEKPNSYQKRGHFDFSGSSSSSDAGLVSIHKRGEDSFVNNRKRKRIVIKPNEPVVESASITIRDIKDYLLMVKSSLLLDEYEKFVAGIKSYRETSGFEEFCNVIETIFLMKSDLHYLILGLEPYIKEEHKTQFQAFYRRIT